ncbi:MAG: AAA-like domain-containing protein [Nitrososphaera sp.]|nr:AAA-like domain-containing protein [Nitrososphaera sp.]
MRLSLFKAGGALTEEHAAIYIERQADHEVLTHLQAMDYLLVIEPRQQGKTSLVNHLIRHPVLDNIAFAYIDVATPDRSTEESWYHSLCSRILRQLRSFIPRDRWPDIPQNSAGWRDFLSDVALCAIEANRRVVIALDEIGAVSFPEATAFFSVLRDIYNSRQAETEFKQITFWLVGAFHPRDLIKDDKISPFNIAQRVRLPDFTLTQVRKLVSKGNWSDEQVAVLAEHIHYWTDGQPYLTQLLCTFLGPEAKPADVKAGIERLRREDENHLPPMLERLNSDQKLRDYVAKIQAGERIKFFPRENRRQAQLELLGILKADKQGYCTIRNRIYELVLEDTSSATTASIPQMWPQLQRVEGDGQLLYRRGIEELEKCFRVIGGSDLNVFENYSQQLLTNLQDEEQFGRNQDLRQEINKIVSGLNKLTRRVLNEPFNDFAKGELRYAGSTTKSNE